MLKLKDPTDTHQKQHPYVLYAILGVFTLNFFSSCGAFLSSSRNVQLAADQSTIYVQTQDDETVQAQKVDPLHREEELLRNYAYELVKVGWTWNGGSLPKKHNDNVYPGELFAIAQSIDPLLRDGWLAIEHQKYEKAQQPIQEYLTGQWQSVVEIKRDKDIHITQLQPGQWQIHVISIRTHRSKDGKSFPEKLNKKLVVEAVIPTQGEAQRLFGDTYSHLNHLITKYQHHGLMITSMEDF